MATCPAEKALASEGITDLDKYAVEPGTDIIQQNL